MLRNYLQSAFRSLYRNKLSTFINIVGLSLAISCCIPFYQIIRYETSFDHFHDRADRMYRVILDWSGREDGGHVHFPAVQALQTDFPDFERITSIRGPVSGKISVDRPGKDPILFNENQMLFVDQNFLRSLDFKAQATIALDALERPNQVLLTTSLARKLFAGADPVGKSIILNDHLTLLVVGILENPPLNTNLPFRMLVSYITLERDNSRWNDWLFPGDVTVYVTLRDGDRPEKFRERLEKFTEKHVAFYKPGSYFYRLQPLKEIHTSSGFNWDTRYYAPQELIWLPAFLGIVIIVIACVNFVNLSMAHALTQTRETGVRKVVGSTKVQVLFRFLLQTLMVVFVAMLLGLLGGYLLLHQVNVLFAIVDYRLALETSTFLFLGVLGLVILLMAGLYPALLLAHVKPALIFRSQLFAAGGNSLAFLRKSLVVLQISSSVVLLVSALVISSQIKFWRETDLNFRQASIITFPVPGAEILKKEALRNALQGLSGVQGISFSSGSPMFGKFGSARIAGTKDYADARIIVIDDEFGKLYQLKLAAGNMAGFVDQPFVLINQKMALLLGFRDAADAVGNSLEIDILLDDHATATITGVIENYVNGSPIDATTFPSVLLSKPVKATQANVSLIDPISPAALAHIELAFRKTFPNEIFETSWITTQVESGYMLESLIEKAVRFISGLSVLIGCIGIYGIVSFMGTQRSKEFSVRKVFGASGMDIGKIFLREFGILVVTGSLIGGMVAVWLLQEWLQQYSNHLKLEARYLLEALLIITLVTVTTILRQARRSANINPAETLRGD